MVTLPDNIKSLRIQEKGISKISKTTFRLKGMMENTDQDNN